MSWAATGFLEVAVFDAATVSGATVSFAAPGVVSLAATFFLASAQRKPFDVLVQTNGFFTPVFAPAVLQTPPDFAVAAWADGATKLAPSATTAMAAASFADGRMDFAGLETDSRFVDMEPSWRCRPWWDSVRPQRFLMYALILRVS